MIDRIVHHAEVHTLKGSSYRFKDTGMTHCAPHEQTTRHNNHYRGLLFDRHPWPTFGPASTHRLL